jgi:phosphohistidine phosphatase SixA
MKLVLAALAIWLLAAPVAAADDSQEAWAALVNGSHVALIRHGNAPPGYGDPPGFKIDDCATQRNLDEKGRAQATALGEAFRQHGVRADKILSSPWCRCLETARLMVLGPVDGTWAVAASYKSPERLAALRQMLADWRGPGTLVVVTHALTVQALSVSCRARQRPWWSDLSLARSRASRLWAGSPCPSDFLRMTLHVAVESPSD